MAIPVPVDRWALARAAVRRRAVRARLVAFAFAVAVAIGARAAIAQVPARGEGAPLSGIAPAARVEPASATGEMVRLGVALAVVLAIVFAARWWIRRSGMARALSGDGAFEVLARAPVGRGQQVLAVRFGPRVLCVHQGRDGMRTLAELSDPAEVASFMARARGASAAAAPPAERVVDLRAGKGGQP
jgi:flagellar biogenesis protein FliO